MSNLSLTFLGRIALTSILLIGAAEGLTAQDQWRPLRFFQSPNQPSQWDSSFAFGLNGTGGNSQNADLNLNLDATRKTDIGTTDFTFSYFYSESNLVTSTDRIFSKLRHEHHLANPNLSWYFSGTAEWDQFTGYDYRLAFHSGFGWLLLNDSLRTLKTRTGVGTSREFGGDLNDWVPELQFGMDWERKLSARTKLYATVDYYPDFDNFVRYRVNTKAGIETLLDSDLGLSLRTFVLNRYNSTPDPGFEPNDVDYGLTLAFDF